MKIGAKVRREGNGEEAKKWIGTVVEYYGDNMVHVRFPGGVACEDIASLVEIVPQEAKESDFGCNLCLWNGVECKEGSKYISKNCSLLCAAYTYCD